LAAFLVTVGVFRKEKSSLMIALGVGLLYSGMLLTILPTPEVKEAHISWEGHLVGVCVGTLFAFIFRKKKIKILLDAQQPPQNKPTQESAEQEQPMGFYSRSNNSILLASMQTIILLLLSNIFMTFAWYGHLNYKHVALWKVILISWGIAFFEYCLQVPANRYGYGQFTATQLKIIQEVLTLVVFMGFSVLYLKEEMKWNYLVGFVFLVLAVFFIFKKF
jgi:uncharacterized protein